MVQWTDKYTTGSDTLDQQHQTLIDNINRLEEMLLISHPSREQFEAMIEVVDFLEFYASAHFKAEEACMEAYRCPAHAQNKQAHADFLKYFNDFKEHNRAKGFPRDIIVQLHDVASRWIHEHILQIDTRLRPCMKGV